MQWSLRELVDILRSFMPKLRNLKDFFFEFKRIFKLSLRMWDLSLPCSGNEFLLSCHKLSGFWARVLEKLSIPSPPSPQGESPSRKIRGDSLLLGKLPKIDPTIFCGPQERILPFFDGGCSNPTQPPSAAPSFRNLNRSGRRQLRKFYKLPLRKPSRWKWLLRRSDRRALPRLKLEEGVECGGSLDHSMTNFNIQWVSKYLNWILLIIYPLLREPQSSIRFR